ncbi:MAG: glycosyltransferase family 2 protein [Clostridia bacterium]|nr:glycosyltransferase family 2 protein [Clostridia bacterium]
MINDVFRISTLVFLIILAVGVFFMLYRLVFAITGFTKRITFKEAKKNHKFAVLIPARNESNVISDLLTSLQNQDYDKNNFDVYVIVKSEKDKTIEICDKFGYKCFVEPNQKCKGDALDFTIKHIYENNLSYDAFVIFDADNIPTQSFLTEINKAVDAGYDIGIGYRNSKNWNDGWISAGTGLTFSLINSLSNKARTKFKMNCVFSGTGYFIRESVLSNFKGWPFKSLTEDYEISMYATCNNLKTAYVENAEFFDEQPVDLKTSFKQRVRWVKGFTVARSLYSKKLFSKRGNFLSKLDFSLGVVPAGIIIADCILYGAMQIALLTWALIAGHPWVTYLLSFVYLNIGIYAALFLFTLIQILVEGKRIDMKLSRKIELLFCNPFYTALYVPIAIKAIFSKNIGWDTIAHNKTMTKK